MTTWECQRCGTVYSVGAPCCPHCGADDYLEDGGGMNAKISKAGGPSYQGVDSNDDAGAFPTGRAGESTESDTQSTTVDTDQDHAEDRGDGNDYDPGEYTVNEVNAYLDDCRDEGNTAEYDRVIAEERGGKARTGILNRGSGG